MKNYIFLSVIVLLVATILIQNQLHKEKEQILGRNFWIAYHFGDLKEGMSKEEVLKTLGFPPEDVSKDLGIASYEIFTMEDGTLRLHWSNYNAKGTLREFLGIKKEPKSSMDMDLHLDFDKDERLIRIYYGG
jgi:hypothetical protein